MGKSLLEKKRRNPLSRKERLLFLLREGANHTVYVNRREKKVTTVPRHNEIDENLVTKICKDLGIAKVTR